MKNFWKDKNATVCCSKCGNLITKDSDKIGAVCSNCKWVAVISRKEDEEKDNT